MNTPGTMGAEWLAKEIARADARSHATAAIRETATQEEPIGDLMVEINRATIRADNAMIKRERLHRDDPWTLSDLAWGAFWLVAFFGVIWLCFKLGRTDFSSFL